MPLSVDEVATILPEIPLDDQNSSAIPPATAIPLDIVVGETRRVGGTSSSVYWLFCKASSWRRLAGVGLCLTLQQGCIILTRYWLKWWGEAFHEELPTRELHAFMPRIRG